MTAADTLSVEDKEFLAQCEEEFKDRFTEKDENFMKVFNAEPSVPPIMFPWWVSQNAGRRNDRRNNRRNHPYERHGNRDRFGNDYDGRSQDRSNYRDRRAYNDYGDRSHGYRNQRNQYY